MRSAMAAEARTPLWLYQYQSSWTLGFATCWRRVAITFWRVSGPSSPPTGPREMRPADLKWCWAVVTYLRRGLMAWGRPSSPRRRAASPATMGFFWERPRVRRERGVMFDRSPKDVLV